MRIAIEIGFTVEIYDCIPVISVDNCVLLPWYWKPPDKKSAI